jgi:hypothetical protein
MGGIIAHYHVIHGCSLLQNDVLTYHLVRSMSQPCTRTVNLPKPLSISIIREFTHRQVSKGGRRKTHLTQVNDNNFTPLEFSEATVLFLWYSWSKKPYHSHPPSYFPSEDTVDTFRMLHPVSGRLLDHMPSS